VVLELSVVRALVSGVLPHEDTSVAEKTQPVLILNTHMHLYMSMYTYMYIHAYLHIYICMHNLPLIYLCTYMYQTGLGKGCGWGVFLYSSSILQHRDHVVLHMRCS